MSVLTPVLDLNALASAPSKTEQDSAARTQMEIREYLAQVPSLSHYNIDTFLHGSYKNATTVRRESDVDVGSFSDRIYFSDHENLTPDDIARWREARTDATFTFEQYRSDVLQALVRKYGRAVRDGNKAIEIQGEGSRMSADVLPCVSYRYYWRYTGQSSDYTDGIAFKDKQGKITSNFPHQHFEGLTDKNLRTNGTFKGCIRILKSIRLDLIERGEMDDKFAPSCYIESLLWNVPDGAYIGGYPLAMQTVLGHLYADITEKVQQGKERDYLQANGYFFLFHPQFWSTQKAISFILSAWGEIFPSR